MSQTLSAGTVYVQDFRTSGASRLYVLELATGRTRLIGSIGTEIYDLSFVGQTLYGLDKKDFGFRKSMKLIAIDPTTAKAKTVGDTGYDVVGLACNPVNQKLYATAHRDSQIVELDLETGKGTAVVTLSDRDRLCGELAFDSEGCAYITLLDTDLKKYLATCDLTTGEVRLIGDIGFPGLASMEFINNTLYGVAGNYQGVGGSNGQVIRIDTATGKGTLVTTTDPFGCWAGLAVYSPVSKTLEPVTPSRTPEPAVQNVTLGGDRPASPQVSVPPSPTKPQPTNSPVPVFVTAAVSGDHSLLDQLSFSQFERNPATDIVCVAPVRTLVRREEEIVLIRRVRKVEEVEASPTCPTGTTPQT
ncbi:hypothetical protein PN498_16160 [Oscillatoria sp. CS-180]|uniref:YncE family protein n=1 Tax=Oscillatoria sp. CS-180 TaxID=3021720 RepID=UPI00232EC3A7|nr:hypothetical protein [Oscillatoria sp. CS-180]MDB9527533.1 hypothetical protein [Oscillatoria sp. CS-180]